jgi:spore germination protein YaaH
MNKSGRIIILIFIIIVLGVGGVFSYVMLLKPNEEMTTLFDSTKINFIVEDRIIKSNEEIIKDEDSLYMPMSLVKSYIDENINWDKENKRLTITTKDKVIRLKTEALEAFVNDKPYPVNIPVKIISSKVYIPVDFLTDFYNIEFSYVEKNNVLILDYPDEYNLTGKPLVDKVYIREGRSIKNKVLGTISISSGVEITIFEEYDKWYKVRTGEGILGFVQKKDLKVRLEKKNEFNKLRAPGISWKPEKGKINLVWELVAGGRIDTSLIPEMKSVDVISPTWFRVQNKEGYLLNGVDKKYLEWAQGKGYQVWALVANDFNNPENTGIFLRDSYARENFIREILTYAAVYNLDGINMDFENINIENKEDYIQLIRELTPMLHEQGLVVSVDVGVPDGSVNWSQSHDRKAIAEIVDYVMVMTYDQHWSSSNTAGSVAQYSWMEGRLKRTLEEVPREKLLLGIPNYIRVWKETNNKASSSGVISIRTAKDYLLKKNAIPVWDSVSGQYYAEFTDEGIKKRVWLEDTNSIDLKTSLVLKYNLAGAATWKRSDSNKEIWEVYNKNLKEYENYNQWQENYKLYDFGMMEQVGN